MEREACVCDHGFERSDLCAEIIIIIIITWATQNYFCYYIGTWLDLLNSKYVYVVCRSFNSKPIRDSLIWST